MLYSNRSACYCGLNQWSKAAADAKECIRLDPTFVKGYYRLVTAQIELQDYNAAAATIRQGLSVDDSNPQLLKQQRTVQQLKRTAESMAKRQQQQQQQTPQGAAATAASIINSAVPTGSSELEQLQRQFIQTNRELEMIKVNMSHRERERKVSEFTKNEVLQMDNDSSSSNNNSKQEMGYYRSVGKMFLRTSRDEIVQHLDKSMAACQQKEDEMKKQSEYLMRQVKLQRENMQELVNASSAE